MSARTHADAARRLLAVSTVAALALGLPTGQARADASAQPTANPDLGAPVATLSSHRNHGSYLLDLFAPVRTAQGVVLAGRLHYEQMSTPSDWQFQREMATDGSNFSVYHGRPNGIVLVDVAGRRAYRPSALGLDESVCTPELPKDFTPGIMVTFSCLYRVPDQVSEVTLVSEYFGRVPHVAISPTSDKPAALPVPTTSGEVNPRASDVTGGVHDLVGNVVDTGGAARVSTGSRTIDVTLDSNVLFAKDSATIQPAAKVRLSEVADQLRSKGAGALAIVGYTDDLGSAEHGLELSRQRAAAVARQLGSLPGVTVTTEGKGEADPAVPNTDETNRAKNRRVELHYRKA